MAKWTVGDVSASETLTDNDHLYPAFFNELRVATEKRLKCFVVGTEADKAQYQTIQSALDAANTAGGGLVYLLEGTHNISTQLEIYNNITLMGAGWGTILRATGSMVGMIHTGNGPAAETSNWVIKDIQFDGNDVAKNGVWGENANNWQVRNCYSHDIGANAADSNGNVVVWGENGLVFGNRIKNSNFNARGVFVTAVNTFDTIIAENTIENCYGGIETDDSTARVIISGNTIRDSRQLGITTSTVGSLVIVNNAITWSSAVATSLGIGVAGNASTTVYDAVISNNYIDCKGSGGDANGSITLNYLQNASITGNVVKNGKANGGIYADNCLDLVITGNRCYDDQIPKTQRYGIYSTGTSNYFVVVGNDCRGNLTGSISLVGANNVSDHNIV